MRRSKHFLLSTLLLLLVMIGTALKAESPQTSNPCGMGPSDWCPAAAGDACGKYRDLNACKNDPSCQGISYKGESVVACQDSPTGFSPNCPSVGCMSKCERLDKTRCETYAGSPWYACAWVEGRCWRGSDPQARLSKNPK